MSGIVGWSMVGIGNAGVYICRRCAMRPGGGAPTADDALAAAIAASLVKPSGIGPGQAITAVGDIPAGDPTARQACSVCGEVLESN